MTRGANFDVQFVGQSGPGRELIPTAADDLNLVVLRVDIRFHGLAP